MRDDRHSETDPDQALEDPTFEELFDTLRAAGSRPVPRVGPQLAAMLASGVAAPGPRGRRVRGATVGLVVVGVLAGGVGAAAAAGHLQRSTRPVTHAVDPRTPLSVTAGTGEPSPTAVLRPPTSGDPGQNASTEPDPAEGTGTDSEGSPETATTPPHPRTPTPSQGPATDDADDGSQDADETGSDQPDDDEGGEDLSSESGAGESGGDPATSFEEADGADAHQHD